MARFFRIENKKFNPSWFMELNGGDASNLRGGRQDRGEQTRTSSGSTSPWGGPEPLGSGQGTPQPRLLTLQTCPNLVRY